MQEFEEYFAGRAATMRSTAYLLCGNWHEAEDLVQAAFAKLYVAWNRVAEHEALDGYVRQILLRLYLDDRRRVRHRRERLAAELPELPERSVSLGPVDDRLVLMRALAAVPARQRAALVLRYWEDLSIEETARVLRCSTGTVKSQTARGLVSLRRALERTGHERTEEVRQ